MLPTLMPDGSSSTHSLYVFQDLEQRYQNMLDHGTNCHCLPCVWVVCAVTSAAVCTGMTPIQQVARLCLLHVVTVQSASLKSLSLPNAARQHVISP